MFKNLKQKTLNSTPDTSILSSRSTSCSSLTDPTHNDSFTSDPLNASTSDLTQIEERVSYGNIDVVINDLRRELQKKENDNKKHSSYIKDCENKITSLVDSWNKEVECRQQLERAYELLEDSNEIKRKELVSKAEMDKKSSVQILEQQCERLKKDNEKLSRKANAVDVKKLLERAELAESRYNELSELQEHSEIQIQKMKDLFKLKDEEFTEVQSQLVESESRAVRAKEDFEAMTVTDVDELRAAQLAEREAEYTKEIEALTESVASLETKLADKEFRINRLRDDVKSKESTIVNLTSSSAELSDTVNRLNENLIAVQTELDTCKESFANSLSVLQEELDTNIKRYEDMKSEHDKQKQLVEQLQIAAVATKTVRLGLEKELGEVQCKVDEQSNVIEGYSEQQREHTKRAEEFINELERYSAQSVELSAMREEIAALQQNEAELLQEKEYLIVAQESWITERNDTVEEMRVLKTQYDIKLQSMQADLSVLRSSNSSNILPVSSSLQARFGKGVTEIDIGSKKDYEEDLTQLRQQCLLLETELNDKNKLLKQNQQHLNDLKKTLQNEIRGGVSSPGTSRGGVSSPGTSRHNPPAKSEPERGIIGDDDLNLEYLKHCVIKYITSPDSESNYLIRVISVLLKFTPEERNIVQDYLKYKASWFKNQPKSLKKLKSTLGSPTRSRSP